jgi:hypothetical protein
VTERSTGYAAQAPGRPKKSRLNIWLVVAVVVLPLAAASLRLPVWSSLLLLLAGVALLGLYYRMRAEQEVDPKRNAEELLAAYAGLQSARVALQESPSDADAQQRLSRHLAECLSLLRSCPESDWGPHPGYLARVREDVVRLALPTQDRAGYFKEHFPQSF